MHCREFRDHLTAWLDDAVDAGLRDALDEHAAECAECGRLAAEWRAWSSTVAEALHHDAPADLRTTILDLEPKRWHDLVKRRVWVPALATAAVLLIAVNLNEPPTGDPADEPFGAPGPVLVLDGGSPRGLGTALETGSLSFTGSLFQGETP